MARNIPIIKNIPAFNTLPKGITSANLRFYKLSNLVLTLGMLVHLNWIFLFFYFDAPIMVFVNLGSFLTYIFSIVINRKGYHFTSSVIMVLEIVLHQLIAIRLLGGNAGFQNFVVVIGLFPFLMPRGKWGVKSALLAICLLAYILFDYITKSYPPVYILSSNEILFLQISNIIFAFISLAVSGGYFNMAMHETEDLLEQRSNELLVEKNKSDELLLNILPAETALELKNTGTAQPKLFDLVTVLFTDFKNFTETSEKLSPEELVSEINFAYSTFDQIIGKYNIEKIKTIGDSYMCAAGLPVENKSHAVDVVNAALEIRDFIITEKQKRERQGKVFFDIRIGIHSGSVVAGIVGIKKFAYDIWGDTVNTASRLESNSDTNKINISGATYELVKDHFECEYRGKIEVKGKGELEMYYVDHKKILI